MNSLTNADDLGDHIQNQRLPGGYHLTVDEDQLGVFVHHDFHDPTFKSVVKLKTRERGIKYRPFSNSLSRR